MIRMKNPVFYLVDVFAEEKYSGNQLAVVTGADTLTEEQMQKIANEMHFSETTFILSNQKISGGHNVRIFTPSTEVPFAGHPTLGTAYVIRRFISKKETGDVILNLKVGQIQVTFEKQQNGETLWMRQMPPVFGRTFEKTEFEALLGLHRSDFKIEFPIQEVSTGLPFVIVPLKSLDAVKRARINQDLLLKLTKEAPIGILVFCSETYKKENDLNARVFVDAFGIPEDPATGSGNGCLTAYLSLYRYFGNEEVDIRVEQGFEIRRPSLLYLKAIGEGEKQIFVGGQVQLIAQGKFI